MTIAADAGASCDILVETAATVGKEPTTMSQAAAFIQELATYPGGKLSNTPWTHTKEEMEYSENRKCHKIINLISGYMLTPKLEALHRTIK